MATYKIMYNEYMPKPYYVAVRVTTFWQQCSKYYTYKKYAQKALNKLVEKNIKENVEVKIVDNIIDLYYTNNKTNVSISIFETIGEFPYITRIAIGGSTFKENKFKTQEEALHNFIWLVSNNIINEEKI